METSTALLALSRSRHVCVILSDVDLDGDPAEVVDLRKHYAGVWRVSDRRWAECCAPLRLYLETPAEWRQLVAWGQANGRTQAWLRNMLAWMELKQWVAAECVDRRWRWLALGDE